ncbi:MAG: hypothetical protein AAFO03_06760 [Bacteroidota bacterium]
MDLPPDFPFPATPEVPGERKDMRLLQEDKWLMNTEVRYWLVERRSLWHLTMIYIAVDNPLKLICRKIDTYSSEKKAKTFAEIMMRGIRKDARGTLKTNRDGFDFCDN